MEGRRRSLKNKDKELGILERPPVSYSFFSYTLNRPSRYHCSQVVLALDPDPIVSFLDLEVEIINRKMARQ